jgi:mRNA-degrading endonuclease RelE of RelBE toxin-antitoxin system
MQTPKKVTILPEIHRQLEELAEGQRKTVYRMTNEVLLRMLDPNNPILRDGQIWVDEQEGK